MYLRNRVFQSSFSAAAKVRVSAPIVYHKPLCLRLQQSRSITANEKPLPEAELSKGPNQDQLPHVSEEAAAVGGVTGEGGPDLDQSTPVSEVGFSRMKSMCVQLIEAMQVLQRDEKAQEKAPEVMKDDITPSAPKGARSYSTSARRRAEAQAIEHSQDTDIFNSQTMGLSEPKTSKSQPPGQIFGLPELPLPSKSHLKHRYDPIVEQVTNLLMQDGKKSIAQRVRSSVSLSFRKFSTSSSQCLRAIC